MIHNQVMFQIFARYLKYSAYNTKTFYMYIPLIFYYMQMKKWGSKHLVTFFKILEIELGKKFKLYYPIFQLFYHVLFLNKDVLHTLIFQYVLHVSPSCMNRTFYYCISIYFFYILYFQILVSKIPLVFPIFITLVALFWLLSATSF